MLITSLIRSAARSAGPIAAVALLAAGCASANKSATTTAASAPSTTSSSSSAMAGMNMSNTSTNYAAAAAHEMSVDGIRPVPTQILGTADWQGMKITAQAMTAVPFVLYDGATERMVKPTAKTSFHLMVMLNDAQTDVPIPYAGVWATISQSAKVVYDERQWPMLSRYMGPHYGNDVSLPGAGEYTLSLLVSPPVSARHVEYENVWLKPHRVQFSFHWQPV
jgi:uncharacterized protein involved in high-affinity Fe2+ transport